MVPAGFPSPVLHLLSFLSSLLTPAGFSLELWALFITSLLSLNSLFPCSLLGCKEETLTLFLSLLASHLAFSEDSFELFSLQPPVLPEKGV